MYANAKEYWIIINEEKKIGSRNVRMRSANGRSDDNISMQFILNINTAFFLFMMGKYL